MNKTNMGKLLYISLALFSVIFLIQGSVAFRHYNSDFIFKVELVFVVLCLFTYSISTYKTLLKNKYLQFSLIVWVLCCFAKYSFDFGEDQFLSRLLLFKLFHGVFFFFAIGVFQGFIDSRASRSGITNIDSKISMYFVFAVLCALTFGIALIREGGVMTAANVVFQYEVVFILACVFVSNNIPSFSNYLKNNPATTLIFVLWLTTVLISFYLLPNEIRHKKFVYERLDQTVAHALFFIFLYDFLRSSSFAKQALPLMIPSSILIVALIFVCFWLQLDLEENVNWFNFSPMNSHIRHVGYLVTASTCVALVFTLYPARFDIKTAFLYLLLFVSATLLFWTGGRAAVGSALVVFMLVVFYFGISGRLVKSSLVSTFFLLAFSLLIAEQIKVFDWNGILGQLIRTVEATNVNLVTTGRLGIWQASIESLQGHWLFGLGPQGFLYLEIPNQPYIAQPHSMFIQFFVEWGVVGATLFLSLLSVASFKLLLFLKTTSKLPGVVFFSGVAVFVGLSIHGLTDGTYYHSQPSFYIALALALCLSEMTIKKNESE